MLATIPLIAVTLALQAAWLAGTFALWNMELARMQMSADAGALAGGSAGVTMSGPPTAAGVDLRVRPIVEANNPLHHPQRVAVELVRREPGGGWSLATGDEVEGVRVTVVRTGVLGAVGELLFGRLLGWSPGGGRVVAIAQMARPAVMGSRLPPRVLRLIE